MKGDGKQSGYISVWEGWLPWPLRDYFAWPNASRPVASRELRPVTQLIYSVHRFLEADANRKTVTPLVCREIDSSLIEHFSFFARSKIWDIVANSILWSLSRGWARIGGSRRETLHVTRAVRAGKSVEQAARHRSSYLSRRSARRRRRRRRKEAASWRACNSMTRRPRIKCPRGGAEEGWRGLSYRIGSGFRGQLKVPGQPTRLQNSKKEMATVSNSILHRNSSR